MSHVCKVAILIDGGFFTKIFANKKKRPPTKQDVIDLINDTVNWIDSFHPTGPKSSILRTFYYDCLPFGKEITNLKGKKIDFGKSPVYISQNQYIDSLRFIDQFALRLGELSFSGWIIDPRDPKKRVKPDFRQKGVDMKIGLDMAWMAGKKTVDKIALITGDSDFISPIKLVRREGIIIYLDSMAQAIKSGLKEHADFHR